MSSVIKVNDTWYIDVDADNYSVGKIKNIRTTTDKNGRAKEDKRYEGYFTTLESALRFIRDTMIADALSTEDMDLAGAVATVRSINSEFVDAFRKATRENAKEWR